MLITFFYVHLQMYMYSGARHWKAERWAKQEFLNPPNVSRQIITALHRSKESTEFLLHDRERIKRQIQVEKEAVRRKLEQMYVRFMCI